MHLRPLHRDSCTSVAVERCGVHPTDTVGILISCLLVHSPLAVAGGDILVTGKSRVGTAEEPREWSQLYSSQAYRLTINGVSSSAASVEFAASLLLLPPGACGISRENLDCLQTASHFSSVGALTSRQLTRDRQRATKNPVRLGRRRPAAQGQGIRSSDLIAVSQAAESKQLHFSDRCLCQTNRHGGLCGGASSVGAQGASASEALLLRRHRRRAVRRLPRW